jgi:hypothetical protein
MRTLLVGTVSGLVALVGFASTANASATLDLLWGGEDASTSGVADSSSITLHVVLTAGANGSQGGGITVDYSAAVGKLSVVSIVNNPMVPAGVFPLVLGATTDTGSQVRNVNVAAIPGILGTGLTTAGASYLMGTITFHKTAGAAGSFAITTAMTASDDILNLSGAIITGTTTFNNATLNNVPEPGTVSLLALGLGGLALAGRRKN